jgi:hypothetical protein
MRTSELDTSRERLRSSDAAGLTDQIKRGGHVGHPFGNQHAQIRNSRGSNASGQPFVTTGGGALPLPKPAQPETLTATRVATKANTSFFIGAPYLRVVIPLLLTIVINTLIVAIL